MQMTAPLTVTSNLKRELPGHILSALPITLFFQLLDVRWFSTFVMALLVSGEWSEKWRRIRQHPMFMPTGLMFGVSLLSIILHPSAHNELFTSFLHYQIYAFLLLMLALGPGPWQQRAIHVFFVGALIAATLFYCASLYLLPETTLFRSYVIYQGINRSYWDCYWRSPQRGCCNNGWRIRIFMAGVCSLSSM